jgi:hypothetical protein
MSKAGGYNKNRKLTSDDGFLMKCAHFISQPLTAFLVKIMSDNSACSTKNSNHEKFKTLFRQNSRF